MTYSVLEFMKQFPDDDTCLEHLFVTRFGNVEELYCEKCGEYGKFRKLSKMPAYTCNCGHHIHPMKDTPFERSRTPLQKWFYAMYLFTTSRHGVPAKELQRQLGVTYKTAWRMGHEIRKYMTMIDGDNCLSGTVEADETYIGGKRKGKRGRGASGKTVVFDMLERNGAVMTKIVPNASRLVLQGHIRENVSEGSEMQTDEWGAYRGLDKVGYTHETDEHGCGQYARDAVHVNAIEGFWSQIKRSIKGTHIHVSRQHLDKYLGEFEYRYNMRKTPEIMFSRLLASF
ncbi:IS1595 family transposase [uncultured Sneathiella sp.]|uniref:IS1595 family transposase n=1 Tax=uncultured Sneathiella sp. TaxID=879315 RepID=UPI0030EBFB4F